MIGIGTFSSSNHLVNFQLTTTTTHLDAGGGGGTPIHYLYGYVPPNGVVILKLLIRTEYPFQRRFLERGIIFRTHESSSFVGSHLKLFKDRLLLEIRFNALTSKLLYSLHLRTEYKKLAHFSNGVSVLGRILERGINFRGNIFLVSAVVSQIQKKNKNAKKDRPFINRSQYNQKFPFQKQNKQ